MTQPARADEIDLDLVAPLPRVVTVSFVLRGDPEDHNPDGPIVGRQRERVEIAGTLSTPQMMHFLRLEADAHEAIQNAGDGGDQQLGRVITTAANAIADVLSELNPDLFAPFTLQRDSGPVTARRSLELNPQQVLVMLAYLAGDSTVANEVARALTAGASAATDATDDGPAGEGGVPFESSSTGPSPSTFSGSAASTGGSLATGSCREDLEEVSPGASSEPISSTLVAA